MARKQIFVLVGCMIFGIGILVAMFSMSPIGEDIPRQTFSRNFTAAVRLTKEQEIDIKFNSFYLIQGTKNTIYLGNSTAPFHLLQVSLPQLDTQHIILKIPGIKIPNNYKLFRLNIDSPYFYLSHGVMPGLFKGTLKSREATNFLPVIAPYFVEAVPINTTSMALRSHSTDSKAYELAILTVKDPYFEFKPDLLEKQVDGIFCEDGTLHFDKNINKLIYIYHYRNEFFVMDTTLNLINRFHTIDTFRRASIKVAQVTSKEKYSTLASPPARTNLQSCVSRNYLFVQSPFLSKNEDKTRFLKASVIDTYDVNTGKYLYSFYLDNFDGRLASNFIVFGEHLAAIYDHYLIVYKLSMPKTDESNTNKMTLN